MTKTISKFSIIGAFKGIAILGIVLVHTAQHNHLFPSWTEPIFLRGGNGMQMFYILSSLGLFWSMKKRIKNEPHPWRNFYLRRFFRLAPLFYTICFFYLINSQFRTPLWSVHPQQLTAVAAASHLFFLHGVNPYWMEILIPGGSFVSTLALFYLLFPLIYRYISDFKKAVFLFLAAVIFYKISHRILFLWPLVADRWFWDAYLFYYLPSQFPVICLGVIIYYVLEIIDNSTFIKHKNVLAGTIFTMAVFYITNGLYGGIIPQHILMGINFSLSIIAIYIYPFKLIVNRFFIFLGRVSYSIYLTHYIILSWFYRYFFREKFGFGNWAIVWQYIIVLIVSGAVSVVTYNFIEKPGRQIGERLIKRLEN